MKRFWVRSNFLYNEYIDVTIWTIRSFGARPEHKGRLDSRDIAERVAQQVGRTARIGNEKSHTAPKSRARLRNVANEAAIDDSLERANLGEAIEVALCGCASDAERSLQLAGVRTCC
jgi:hypothetical protein